MDAIHVRLELKIAHWPAQLKAARAGQLMVWQLGSSSASPDVQTALATLYGPDAGGQNLARFANARYDDAYRRMQALPDGDERLALLRELQVITAAYAPHKYHVHRVLTDLTQPWLVGYRRPLFGNQFWQYVDIDLRKDPR
jgi:ABC-type transport system substrate-binding protein